MLLDCSLFPQYSLWVLQQEQRLLAKMTPKFFTAFTFNFSSHWKSNDPHMASTRTCRCWGNNSRTCDNARRQHLCRHIWMDFNLILIRALTSDSIHIQGNYRPTGSGSERTKAGVMWSGSGRAPQVSLLSACCALNYLLGMCSCFCTRCHLVGRHGHSFLPFFFCFCCLSICPVSCCFYGGLDWG